MQMAKEHQMATAYLKQGNKTRALQHLKQKKQREGLRDQVNNLNIKLIEQQMQLEGMANTASNITAMKLAANAQKVTMTAVNPDKVMDLFQDIQEHQDQMEEINQAIAQPIGPVYDEDELLEELQMDNEVKLESQVLQPARIPATAAPAAAAGMTQQEEEELLAQLPTVPTGVQPPKVPGQKTEDDELAELMKELA
jgi:charged multivesicular body protein 4A/B